MDEFVRVRSPTFNGLTASATTFQLLKYSASPSHAALPPISRLLPASTQSDSFSSLFFPASVPALTPAACTYAPPLSPLIAYHPHLFALRAGRDCVLASLLPKKTLIFHQTTKTRRHLGQQRSACSTPNPPPNNPASGSANRLLNNFRESTADLWSC